MLKRFMNRLFLSCKQVTELAEKKQVAGLSLIEKIRFNSHLLMCRACRSYEKQSLLMEKMLYRILDPSKLKQETTILDHAAKMKILKKIREAQ